MGAKAQRQGWGWLCKEEQELEDLRGDKGFQFYYWYKANSVEGFEQGV